MPFARKSTVALVAAPVSYDGILKALELVEGSIRDKLSKSSRVVIKPDFFGKTRSSVDAMRAVLDFILEFTNKKITIAEGLYGGGEIQPAFHEAGLHELAEDYGVKFVDLNRDGYVTLQLGRDGLSIAKGSRLSVRVAKTLVNSDFRVSLAVPRLAGSRFFASAANLALGSVVSSKGNDKARLLSSKSYDAEVAEILEVARPSLAVIDGFNSEVNRKAAGTNFAVASADAVAADSIAINALARAISRKIPGQKYLRLCSRAGLGQSSLGRIKVAGRS